MSEMDISIRPIVPGDEGLIEEFFASMGGESRALFNRNDWNRTTVLQFCKEQKVGYHRYWMAEYEGKMAGMVFLWDLQTSIPWLGIGVRDDLHGKHLGSRLIAFVQDYVKKEGKGGIQLTTHLANVRGQALYEKMGFELIGFSGQHNEWYYLFRFGTTEKV